MPSNTIRKARRATERRKNNTNRGVAAAVVMGVDADGSRFIMSPQGDNQSFAETFDSAWKIYIAREKRSAIEQGIQPDQLVLKSEQNPMSSKEDIVT